MTSSYNPDVNERRVHHAVRDVFVQACILLMPLIKNNEKTLNMSNFAMAHILKDNFPELSNVEVHIIITTVERLHRENRLQALPGN